MKDRSTYAKSFLGAPGKKDDYDGIPDNLKTGYQWLGDTTYGDKYRQPNPEDYPAHMKNIDKLLQNPDFKRQYGNKKLI